MFSHQQFRDNDQENNRLVQEQNQSMTTGNMDSNLNQLDQNAGIQNGSMQNNDLNGIIFTSEGFEYDSTLEMSSNTGGMQQQPLTEGMSELSMGQQMNGEGGMLVSPEGELLPQDERQAGQFVLGEEEEEQMEAAQEKEQEIEDSRLPAGSSQGEEIEPFDLAGGESVKETADGDDPNEGGEGGGAGGAIEAPDLPSIDPEDDPDFQGLEERITEQAELHATHEESGDLSESSQSSAPLAENETMGGAQLLQVEEMDEQEPEAFDAAGFKRMLLDRIDSIMPRNEEEAEDFEDDNELDELNDTVGNSVVEERERASGPIQETSEEAPDTSEVVEREVSELQTPEPGQLLTELDAEEAMPDPREEMYVEEPVEQRNEQLDDLMAQNEITDEQLANSNEPQFMEALSAKEEAQAQGTQMTTEVRSNEQNEIQGAEGEAANVNEQGITEMFTDRENFLMQVVQDQEQGSSDNSTERARIAGEIHTIYENTRTDVESILNNLDTQVMSMFETASNRAKNNFENYVDAKMDAYLDDRYDLSLEGVGNYVGDTFTGLPDEVNEFFVEGRNRFIAEMDTAITNIADYIAQELNAAKQRIADGRQQIVDFVEALPEDLQSIGEEAATAIQSRFDELDTTVNNKQGELVNSLAQQYADSLNAVDQRIEEMQAENRGLIDVVLDAVDGVIEVINQIKTTLTNLISSALDAIAAIIADPIGFLGNLIDGISQGLNNFTTNISDHLMSGLIGWLTGAMGSMGITIPENLFSLEGVFDLVCQILGLTWDYVREKAVYAIGEDAVAAIEKSFEIFQILQTEGIMGVWQYIQEQMAGLQEMVIDGIKEFLITNVIEAGIQWMLGLMSPAGAFVKAAMMVIDIVKFFIEQGSQIMALVQSVIDSLAAIAAGNVGFVAQSIEQALANAVPVLIGFLASLIGLDGVAESVQDVIMSVRRRIDDAINGLIDKAKDWFNGRRGGKGDKEQNEFENENEDERPLTEEDFHLEDDEIGEIVPFNVEGESHKIWIEEHEGNAEVMMASKATPIEDKIKQWDEEITTYEKRGEAEKSEEETAKYVKARSMHNLVASCFNDTQKSSIEAAKKAAELSAEEEKSQSIKRNDRNKKITDDERSRRAVIIEREHVETLKTRFEEVDYQVEQSQIALKEAIKRLMLLLEDEDKVKVGEEEVGLTEEDKARISDYYDIAIVGVGSAAARWLYTNTKTYNKGIVIGETGGWKDRGQETTSHPKTLVSPTTPTEEEQSSSGLTGNDGSTIFERADDHVSDIERLVDESGFERLKETSNSIHKKGEWSLIGYGTNKYTIAAKKVVLATGAGPENQIAREFDNERDLELNYKKIATLNEFMNEVEGLNPEELEARKTKFGERKVLLYGSNAVVDAIEVALKLGFDVDPRSRSGFVGHLPGTKNTTSEKEYEDQFNDEEAQKELIAGYYESHKLAGGKVHVSFSGGETIVVDQFVTAIGPDSRQVATADKEAGPIAILGGPDGINDLLQPIYDLGKSYSDEVFATVLGLESEDGLLEVIGAAAFRVGAFVNDTQEAIERYKQLKKEEQETNELEDSEDKKQKLKKLETMLIAFRSVRNKFNNARKAHSKSVIVAEQLGTLNSTIEALNRVNAIENDETNETEERVKEQIQNDGINMQIDNWPSIKRYIEINWERFSNKANLGEMEKKKLAEKAAKAVVSARGSSAHPHGITWEEAEKIITQNL